MRFFSIIIFCFFSLTIQAQSFEIKTRPAGWLFGMYSVSCEYMYAPKISFEFEPFVFDTYEGVNLIEGAGYGANFMSRYYFSPRSENDGLSLATYTSGGLNDAEPFVILGALAGYKFINYKNFTASAELGFGKEIIQPKSNFDDSAILLIKLSAGYYIERGK